MNKSTGKTAKTDKYVTVFIPTFNGDKYLGDTIEAVLHQELPKGYKLEFLVTESGSSDKTLSILQVYDKQKKIILDIIPNSEFGHGKTRAAAAKKAKGEFILFLTQDATPTNYRWLINMIEPFFVSDKVGCVFGRQVPRPDAAATIKREVAGVFGGMGAPDAIVLHRPRSLVDGQETNPINSFFSDANSAMRRELLVGEVPFKDLPYAEDQALAEDMQKHGYIKAYAPLGAVWHSNDYTARQYYHRKFDEFIGLQESVHMQLPRSKKSLLLGWIRPTIADYKFIARDREYGPRRKAIWFARSPFYNMGLQLGRYNAAKYLKDKAARKKLSHEARWRGQ